MDPSVAGIQNTLSAEPGATFTVGLVLTVDAAGVSSYGISVLFDTAELSLSGITPAANNPALPMGSGSLAAPSWNDGLGWVHSFNGATLGLGPVSTSFTIGTISYTVRAVSDDGEADVTPGLLNFGVDGFFDNAGNPVTPTFNPGFVVRPAVDIGLRIFDGTSTNRIACDAPGLGGALVSPLRIAKNGTTYGIVLVATNAATASKIHVQTASGIKACAKLP